MTYLCDMEEMVEKVDRLEREGDERRRQAEIRAAEKKREEKRERVRNNRIIVDIQKKFMTTILQIWGLFVSIVGYRDIMDQVIYRCPSDIERKVRNGLWSARHGESGMGKKYSDYDWWIRIRECQDHCRDYIKLIEVSIAINKQLDYIERRLKEKINFLNKQMGGDIYAARTFLRRVASFSDIGRCGELKVPEIKRYEVNTKYLDDCRACLLIREEEFYKGKKPNW